MTITFVFLSITGLLTISLLLWSYHWVSVTYILDDAISIWKIQVTSSLQRITCTVAPKASCVVGLPSAVNERRRKDRQSANKCRSYCYYQLPTHLKFRFRFVLEANRKQLPAKRRSTNNFTLHISRFSYQLLTLQGKSDAQLASHAQLHLAMLDVGMLRTCWPFEKLGTTKIHGREQPIFKRSDWSDLQYANSSHSNQEEPKYGYFFEWPQYAYSPRKYSMPFEFLKKCQLWHTFVA